MCTARKQGEIDDTVDYAQFARNCTTIEMSTNSKSGSFFFYTSDMKYIIKTIKQDEKRLALL